MKREVTVDYNIKIAWHSISRMYNSYGVNFDITASTGFVLLNIDAEEGTPATKIAPMMGLESRSLTRMLKSMEEKGWIYRQKDPEDGRSVRIFLTDDGKEKREISKQSVKAFNKRVQQRIEPDQLKIFFDVITAINEVAEDKESIQHFIKKMKAQLAQVLA
ncbi:MAG: MarR family winged helix-turn-helix transcriptional regulator [Cyclobacteriaceae bacterium]|jgi:DNA-binding MarR family transcriptional regulator